MPFFMSNTLWGFIVSEVFMLIIFATNIAMMVISCSNKVCRMEVFTVRLPLTLFAGWVTTAAILNTTFMLKSWGMWDGKDVTKPGNDISWDWLNFMMFIDEEMWSIILLWFAFVWYTAVSWGIKNPLYGSVFTWASAAILTNLIKE